MKPTTQATGDGHGCLPLLDRETGIHPRIDSGEVEVGRRIGDIRALSRLAAAVGALVEIGTGIRIDIRLEAVLGGEVLVGQEIVITKEVVLTEQVLLRNLLIDSRLEAVLGGEVLVGQEIVITKEVVLTEQVVLGEQVVVGKITGVTVEFIAELIGELLLEITKIVR